MSAPAYVAPQDWTGRAEDRPGLMWRKVQIQEHLERLRAEREGPPPPVYPDRVLAFRVLPADGQAELAALCNPAKLAMGITAKLPGGQLGPGWRWSAHHGFGINGATGVITESLALKLRNDQAERGALFYWMRPVPDPRLTVGARLTVMWVSRPARWPMLAAVLAQLPAASWSAEFTSSWTLDPLGRPDDMPRATPSAAVKKEIRS